MNEIEFAFRIRQALNEGAESVNYKTVLRLEKARQLAVSRAGPASFARPATVRLPAMQLATAGGPTSAGGDPSGLWSWLRGAGLLAPLVALVVGFVAIYEWHNRKLIEELADLDFAVLLDDTPISAYADKGFGTLLNQPFMASDSTASSAVDSALDATPLEISSPEDLVVEAADAEAAGETALRDAEENKVE